MIKIKSIINYIKSFPFWVCISIAALFWVTNRLSSTITTDIKVPVVLKGVSSNDKIENNTTISLDLKLKSTGYNLIYYKYIVDKDYFSVSIADIDMTKNKDSLFFTLNRTMLEKAIRNIIGLKGELLSIENRNITVGAKHYRQKTIPVRVDASIDFGGKLMQRGDIVINPKQVIVGGTSTIIDTLSYVVTKKIEINSSKNNFTGKVYLDTNPHLVYSTDEIYYTVNTEEYSEKKETYRVRVRGANKSSLVMMPQTVTLTLNIPKNNYYSFDKELIEVYIDYDENRRNSNDEYLVKYTLLSDDMKVVNVEPKFVTVLKSL